MIKYILLCLSILFSFTGVLGAGHPTRLQRLQQMRQSLGSLESNGRIDPERAQQISEEIRELEASEIREMIRSTRTPSRALNLIPIIKDKEYPIYAEVTTGRETRYRKKDSTHHEQIEMDYLKTEIYYYYNGRYNKKPNTEAKFFFWFYDGTTFFPMQVSLIHLNTLQCTSTKADGTKESVHVLTQIMEYHLLQWLKI